MGLLILFGFIAHAGWHSTIILTRSAILIYTICIEKCGVEYSSLLRYDAVSFGVYLPKLRRNLAPPSPGWMEAARSAEKSIIVPNDTASLCMLGRHGIKMETPSSDESSVNVIPDYKASNHRRFDFL